MSQQRMIGYCRVSTEEQADSRLGLEGQEAEIRRACEYHGWRLSSIVRDEGLTGKNIDRPGLHLALSKLTQGIADGLIVVWLDRLSRSVVDFGLLLEWFRDVEATFVALDLNIDTSTSTGELVANVQIAVAQWETRRISERTRAALAVLRAGGKPIGRPSVIDKPELAEWIRARRDEDDWTLRQIAAELNRQGVPTLRGAAQWTHSALQSVLGYKRPPAARKRTDLPEPPARRRRRRER
jgi:DNA invertase Pin-like site-specific DNA recombinase